MSAFTFITLTTGHSVVSVRDDVSNDVIKQLIERINRDRSLSSGWSVELHEPRRQGDAGEVFKWTMRQQGYAISYCVLCWDATLSPSDDPPPNSAKAWAAMYADVANEPGVMTLPPPPAPWLAVTILGHGTVALAKQIGVEQMAQKLLELADAERCVAWALLERAGRKT
jgi:hypothetical protein